MALDRGNGVEDHRGAAAEQIRMRRRATPCYGTCCILVPVMPMKSSAAMCLGIAVADRLDHPVDVGEEHGHLLALALQCLARIENALGQMPRRVGAR